MAINDCFELVLIGVDDGVAIDKNNIISRLIFGGFVDDLAEFGPKDVPDNKWNPLKPGDTFLSIK